MNTAIKMPLILLLSASALTAFRYSSGAASALPVAAHHFTESADNVEVVKRARRAFLSFATACVAHNRTGIAQAVTGNLVVEYDLPDPGMTLTVDPDMLDTLCATTTLIGASDQISDLAIFPMTDPNTVFIQYEIASKADPSTRAQADVHTAIVELRGSRISKIRDFTILPREISSIATGSAHDTIP